MSEDQFSWVGFLFHFEGRTSRKRFWLNYMLPVVMPAIIVAVVVNSVSGHEGLAGYGSLSFVVLLWPTLAVTVKRWHDRNKSGWWVLVNLIPYISRSRNAMLSSN